MFETFAERMISFEELLGSGDGRIVGGDAVYEGCESSFNAVELGGYYLIHCCQENETFEELG